MKNRLEPKDENFVKEETQFEEKKVEATPKKYVIVVDNLALRISPNGEKIGIAPAGNTLITEVKDGFGRLADGSGWVSMQYVRKRD